MFSACILLTCACECVSTLSPASEVKPNNEAPGIVLAVQAYFRVHYWE